MSIRANTHQQTNSLFRLIAWLRVLRGQPLGGAIESILDEYMESGISSEVQHSFNALAARDKKYGRVSLRLRVAPSSDIEALARELERAIKTSREEAIVSVQTKSLEPLWNKLPDKSKRAILKSSAPCFVGAVSNPLFDLWLTLLDENKAQRLRRCKLQSCRRFFIGWPGKKAFCSPACRDRHWTRPARKQAGHKPKPRSSRPRT